MTRARSQAPALILVAILSLLAAAALTFVATRGDDGSSGVGADATGGEGRPGADDARGFLETYVDPDGRVVRHDQGGDTVSEGQAYALLLAVGVDDRATFEEVWRWTDATLRRDDGLLSWRWADGVVVDPSSAADADLDVARALVLAGQEWDEPTYTQAGVELGEALLDHETVTTPAGRVLVAGQWATVAPYDFNPSYVSPVATTLLGEASGDPRWAELETGSRAAVEQLTDSGQLPPDWAEVGDDGVVRPTPGPGGQPVQFGYDAARTLIRHAESCEPDDLAIAASATAAIDQDDAPAVLDLAGSPQSGDASPLMFVAQAAGAAAAGDTESAASSLAEAAQARRDVPTYYGDAWAALGALLLSDDALGGCPPLQDAR